MYIIHIYIITYTIRICIVIHYYITYEYNIRFGENKILEYLRYQYSLRVTVSDKGNNLNIYSYMYSNVCIIFGYIVIYV